MSAKNTGGPAFPIPGDGFRALDGMTLRDYFAAKALIAYHADGHVSSHADTADWCYAMADAMLKARND